MDFFIDNAKQNTETGKMVLRHLKYSVDFVSLSEQSTWEMIAAHFEYIVTHMSSNAGQLPSIYHPLPQ